MKRKKKIAVSIVLCIAMLLSMMPVCSSAYMEDFAVLEIPIYKTVEVEQGNPGKTTFSFELVSERMPPDTQYVAETTPIDTNGAGTYDGVLKLTVPTERDFWNMTEGFIIREIDEGEEGWIYDPTEWLILPYMNNYLYGTAAAPDIGVAIYDAEDENSIDYNDHTGSRDGIYFTNVYNLPGGDPNPTDVKITIPYTKTVVSYGGSSAPAKNFTLELGLDPLISENCSVSGDVIHTNGEGVYSGSLVIAPQDEDTLNALIGGGFAVNERDDSSDLWECDTAEWFVTVTENRLGGISTSIYNLTLGDKPGMSASRDEIEFTNKYTPSTTVPGPDDDLITITYDPNGGSVEDPVEIIEKGKTVTLTKTASRDSWTFLGWFESKSSTERLMTIKPETDVTVYAHWKQTDVPDILNGTDHTNYVIGYEDGTIRPLNEITRAEVTMIFYRLLKDEIREANFTTSNSFDDVSPDSWYNDAVSTMGKIGIIKGRGDSTFDPNAPITRAEYAAICSRFDDSEVEELSSFTDISGNWAEAYIKHAVAIGWVKGYSDNTFRPAQKITRAESMTMTNRVLQRLPENAGDLLPEMKTFSDNMDPNAWYYLAVQEASNSHEYEIKPNGREKWTAVI